MKLHGQLKRFHVFLTTKRAGDIVTTADILSASGWAHSSFTTNLGKNHFVSFLLSIGGDRFTILKDGNLVTEDQVQKACTQVRPGILTLGPSLEFKGQHGAYELLLEKGRGAVAHVWKCKVKGTDQFVAVKVMNPREDLLDPAKLENVKHRFVREAANTKGLAHPNIVTHLDRGEYKGHPFLVMSLADRSLGSVLKEGPVSLAQSLKIVQCCLAGLKYLHESGCVHRDVKPDNMLQFGTEWVIGDLGIVQWSDMNPAFTSAGTITRNSMQLGSWHYMAPEQRRTPHDATPASDVYALGVSWYEMLTCRTPDPAEAGAGEFEPASDNAEVQDMIRKMLSFKPVSRPGMDELTTRVGTMLGQ